MDYFGSMRTCSSCAHWNNDSNIPDQAAGVMIGLCESGQQGHDRNDLQEWMRGSDRCSKWEKKKIITMLKFESDNVAWTVVTWTASGLVYFPKGYCCLCGKKLVKHEYMICDVCDFQTG